MTELLLHVVNLDFIMRRHSDLVISLVDLKATTQFFHVL